MEEKSMLHSKSSIIRVCISFLIIIIVIFILASYLINDDFRNIVDTKILKKEVTENSSYSIEIDSDSNLSINAYQKYITVLAENVLTFYNQEASSVAELDIEITTPCISVNDNYFVVAEDGGQKIYLIGDTSIKWEKDIEGEIYRVNVNQNGYVTVLLKSEPYKSIVVLYNTEGKELFKQYLSQSYAICSEVSKDNQYLAVGQVDYSGTVIKSIVNMISINSAMENSKNAIVYTYESESSKIINNIKFNSKNEVISMFDSYIQKITVLSDERLYDITDDDLFVDINLEDNFAVIQKESSELFSSEYQVAIKSTIGKSDKLYILDNDVPKSLDVTSNLICVKLLDEVKIINSSGWLQKRYTTSSEIQDIVVSDNIIGIVYHNKIEIINL